MINRVVLVGRLTKDIDLRRTPNGNAVVSFTIAVNNRFANKEEGRGTADFINCVAWNKLAEIMNDYLKKGMQIAIDGRIQSRSYLNKDGAKVYTTEVVCENMQMLDGKSNFEESTNNQKNNDKEINLVDDNSFDLLDDELPF